MWIAITKYRFLDFRPDITTHEIMNNVLDIIILANHQGHIVEINKQGVELLNFNRNETIGRSIYKIIRSDENVAILQKLIKLCIQQNTMAEIALKYSNNAIKISRVNALEIFLQSFF